VDNFHQKTVKSGNLEGDMAHFQRKRPRMQKELDWGVPKQLVQLETEKNQPNPASRHSPYRDKAYCKVLRGEHVYEHVKDYTWNTMNRDGTTTWNKLVMREWQCSGCGKKRVEHAHL